MHRFTSKEIYKKSIKTKQKNKNRKTKESSFLCDVEEHSIFSGIFNVEKN